MINFIKRNEIFAFLCIENAILMLGMGLISPILPQYVKSFGVNITMVGFLITAFGLARLIFDMPAGKLVDRFGRRSILIIGPLILALGSVGCGFANNYWTLLSFRLVQGIGSSIFMTAAMIMIADIVPSSKRGQMMSWYQGSFFIGVGLGPTVGGFAAQYLGQQAPFFLLSLLALLAAVWAFLRIPETRHSTQPQVITKGQSIHHNSIKTNIGYKPLLKDVNFVLISIITLGIFFTRAGAQNQLLPLLSSDRLGQNTAQIGVSLTLISIVNFIVLMSCGKLSDRFGRKTLVTPGIILTAISLFMLSQSHDYWFLIMTCIFWGLGTGIAGPIPAAYVVDIIKQENYGNGMSLYRTAGDIGTVAGPILSGWLVDLKGYDFSLYFNAGFLLLAGAIFQLLAKEPSRPILNK